MTPEERLAARLARLWAEECARSTHGFLWSPLDETPAHHAALVAVCRRLLAEKRENDDAWFAWTMAGDLEGRDPEAPPMPRSSWP